MHGIHKLFLIGFITFYLSSAANALQCLSCKDMPSPEDCRVVTTCSSNSQCYVEQVVSSGGIILYNTGCRPRILCHNKRSLTVKRLLKRQETGSVTDIGTCIQCCTGDFCNIEGCGKITLRQPQRPPLCFSCMDHLDPNSCRDVTLCDANHMCALKETITYSHRHWKSECIPTLQCEAMKKLVWNGFCFTCCQDDFCNNNCGGQTSTQTSALKTLPSTVAIVIPTKLTQTLQTTPMSTSSSTVLTTKTSAVSLASTQRSTSVTTTEVNMSPIVHTTAFFSPVFTNTVSFSLSAKPLSSMQMSSAEYFTLDSSRTSLTTNSVSTATTSALSPVTTAQNTSPVTTKESTSYQSTVNNALVSNITSGCKNKTFDICFVVDVSGSLGRTGFENELHFISEVVKTISYESNAATHFCLVTFSAKSDHAVNLTEFQNVDQVLNAAETVSFITGETNTHHGLNDAQHQLIHNGRFGADHELILITDGQSNEPDSTFGKATHAKRHGVEIYVIGIGSQTNSSELERIATDKSHLFQVYDVDHLETQYINIVQALCKDTSSAIDESTQGITTLHKSTSSMTAFQPAVSLTSANTKASTVTAEVGSSEGTTALRKSTTTLLKQTTDSVTSMALPSASSENSNITDGIVSYTTTVSTATQNETKFTNATSVQPLSTQNEINSSEVTSLHPLTHVHTTETPTSTTPVKQPLTILLTSTKVGSEGQTTLRRSTATSLKQTTDSPTSMAFTSVSSGGSNVKDPVALYTTTVGAAKENETEFTNATSVQPLTEVHTTKTATTTTTTPKQRSTKPPQSISCATCSGPEFLCEKLYEMKRCETPNNYCVNKLSNHKDGTRLVIRGCGNLDTCYRDWYLGSSDSDKCRKFDEHNLLTLNFDCTYCCVTDGCNVPVKPHESTLFKNL